MLSSWAMSSLTTVSTEPGSVLSGRAKGCAAVSWVAAGGAGSNKVWLVSPIWRRDQASSAHSAGQGGAGSRGPGTSIGSSTAVRREATVATMVARSDAPSTGHAGAGCAAAAGTSTAAVDADDSFEAAAASGAAVVDNLAAAAESSSATAGPGPLTAGFWPPVTGVIDSNRSIESVTDES